MYTYPRKPAKIKELRTYSKHRFLPAENPLDQGSFCVGWKKPRFHKKHIKDHFRKYHIAASYSTIFYNSPSLVNYHLPLNLAQSALSTTPALDASESRHEVDGTSRSNLGSVSPQAPQMEPKTARLHVTRHEYDIDSNIKLSIGPYHLASNTAQRQTPNVTATSTQH